MNKKEVPCKLFSIRKDYYHAPNFTDFIKIRSPHYKKIIKNDSLGKFHKNLNAIFMSRAKVRTDGSDHGYYYQEFPGLGITGSRPTEKRFKLYGLKQFVSKKTKVLDVGSNPGFFSLFLSKFARSVDAIEPNKSLVELSNYMRDYLKIKNCSFHNMSFEDFQAKKKYDFILSLAVHRYMRISFGEYMRKMHSILNVKGKVLLESHTLEFMSSDLFTNTISQEFTPENVLFKRNMAALMKQRLFKIIKKGKISDTEGKRDFYVLEKI